MEDNFKYYEARIKQLKDKFNLQDGLIVDGLAPRPKEGTPEQLTYERETIERVVNGKKLMVSNANYQKNKIRMWLEISK